MFICPRAGTGCCRQYRQAERRFGPIGVAGVYGVGDVIHAASPGMPARRGADRLGRRSGPMLRDGPELPAPVATLDELLLVVPRDSPLRFDPELGFHLYGARSLPPGPRARAGRRGPRGAVPAQLAERRAAGGVLPSAEVFARKWADRLPVATPCVVFDDRGRLFLLGNADPDDGTTARPEGPCVARPVRDLPSRRLPLRRERRIPRRLASIIVPCWNQLEFTRLCLQALFRYTRPPWELIVVDNGSTDGTGEYLAGVQDAAPVPVTVITNARNRRVPGRRSTRACKRRAANTSCCSITTRWSPTAGSINSSR